MKQINPIFEALSNVDERHIPVSKAKKHSKKLKIALISAAAAAALAVTLLAGSVRVGTGVHKFIICDDGSESEIVVELTPYELTIPEEVSLPLSIDDPYYGGKTDNAREMFDKLGVEPFMNENFDYSGDYATFDIWQLGNPSLGIFEITLNYWLFDKNLGKDVYFNADYVSDPKHCNLEVSIVGPDDKTYEILTLNDGSQCVVTSSQAGFAYNGIMFRFRLDKETSNINDVKQVLTDLGVL